MKPLACVPVAVAAVAFCFGLLHCASSANGGADGAGDGAPSGASPDGSIAMPIQEGGGGADAFSPLGDGAVGDGGPCDPRWRNARCPQPPAGAVRCGMGAIDPAAAAAACSALNPPFDLGMGITKACSAFTITAGHYEVWCAADSQYLWVSIDSMASTDVTPCAVSASLPDGAVVTGSYNQLSWDLQYANTTVFYGHGMLRGNYPYSPDRRTMDPSRWVGSVAFDGKLTLAPAAKGTGTVYFATAQGSCNSGAPTTPSMIVLAAPITWGM